MAMLTPRVSVVIPCRNERQFIEGCLDSVLRSEPVAGGFEIIVVDGISEDGTREILEKYQALHPHLRVLDNPQRIVPTGLNLSIPKAKGEWIVRLDAHSTYPPDYLSSCIETAQRTGADNIGGIFVTEARTRSAQARLVQALTTHRFGVGNADYRLHATEGPADTVPYGCFRREIFGRIGWFDERLVRNQDYEFNRRLARAGGSIWLNPAIRVYYCNQGSLKGLLRQAVLNGQWNSWMWYLAPYTFTPRHLIPGLFAAILLGALSLAAFAPGGWVLLALTIAPYLAMAGVAAWQQARRYGWWMWPLLPALFLAYHLAYGAGILRGAAALAVRRSPVLQASEPWAGAGSYRVQVGRHGV